MRWTVNGKSVPDELVKPLIEDKLYRAELRGGILNLVDVSSSHLLLMLTAVGAGLVLGFFLALGFTRAFGI
jgi:hypothetical protein